MKAKLEDHATLADGLSGVAEPSERVAPATLRVLFPVSWSGSIGFALSDSESGDPKPTPSQTDAMPTVDDVEMLSQTTSSLVVGMFVGSGWSKRESCVQ